MSDSAPPASAQSAGRLASVEMVDWNLLGAPLRLDVGAEFTVLVGKNAAGKSLILEGLDFGSLAACADSNLAQAGPRKILFEFDMLGQRLGYEYTWSRVLSAEEDAEEVLVWEERCFRPESGQIIWEVKDEAVLFENGVTMPMPPRTGLLHLTSSKSGAVPPETRRLRRTIRGFRRIAAGVPRSDIVRVPVRLVKGPSVPLNQRKRQDRRFIALAAALASWSDGHPDVIEHFTEVCRRLGIASRVALTDLRDEPLEEAPTTLVKTGTVTIDGTNIGVLSDGTLRLLELVVRLVDPGASLVLIEEPESAIHPGLLRRALAELEAHAVDRQFIISTHSPLVVDWAQPQMLRLVERVDAKTTVRSLEEREVADVVALLSDITLSDYIYSR